MHKKDILQQIVLSKREEIALRKKQLSVEQMQDSLSYQSARISLKKNRSQETSFLIAEFKRKSPSKGVINSDAQITDVVQSYQHAGASAISILTDYPYFMGEPADIVTARKYTHLPILRKDFIVDPFQIHETKYMGADLLLLIASILSKEEMEAYTKLAHEVGLEVIVEIHQEEEIPNIPTASDFVGINNRNLVTFDVDMEHAKRLIALLPHKSIKIAESGIHSQQQAKALIEAGFDGLLVGEYLMKSVDKEHTAKNLIFKKGNHA